MRTKRSCAARGALGVCLFLAGALGLPRASSGDTGAAPEAPQKPSVVRNGAVKTFAYPPRDTSAPRPAVVYLHGRCGAATNGCPHFEPGVAGFGWLVCPPATQRCADGGVSWSGSTSQKQAIVDAAIGAVAASFPGSVDVAAPSVVIGFSQGAYVAVDIVRERPGKYMGMLLIGAEITTTAEALSAAGVKRVVLAAGVYDGARPAMEAEARKLTADGFAARFVSLGTVGHTYVPDREGVLQSSLEWLEGTAAAPEDESP